MTTSIKRTKGTVSQPSGNKTRSEHCQPSLTVDPAARQSHESVVGATASARPARTFSITRHSYGGCDAGGCQLIVSPVRAGTRVATHKLTCPSNCTNCHPVRGESRRQHALARETVAYSQGRERISKALTPHTAASTMHVDALTVMGSRGVHSRDQHHNQGPLTTVC